jgi:hypothetical protein
LPRASVRVRINQTEHPANSKDKDSLIAHVEAVALIRHLLGRSLCSRN